jgi:hypothetical protein
MSRQLTVRPINELPILVPTISAKRKFIVRSSKICPHHQRFITIIFLVALISLPSNFWVKIGGGKTILSVLEL